jgi:hypothetical protein
MVRRLLFAIVLIAVAGAAFAAPAVASRSIAIEEFDAELLVRQNGTVLVTERITLRFDGAWNGFIRTIPIQYRTPGGFGYRLGLKVESIRDEAGNALRYESSREGDSRALQIWVPGAENAARTVVIRYRVRNALRFSAADDPDGARDELYWNITGNEWEMPIRRASARIYLPTTVTGVRALAFTGPLGSTHQAATVNVGEGIVTAVASRSFGPGEGLTVAVDWDAGVVARPGVLARMVGLLGGNWPFALPIVAFLGMFHLWNTRGRDPYARAVMAIYEPPENLTPAEVGTLVDHSADMRDITATLVDLAVRGYLVIEERTEKKLLGLKTETDYVFHLEKPAAEWADLLPHERKLLQALFSGAAGFSFSGIMAEPSFTAEQGSDLERRAAMSGLQGVIGRALQQMVTQLPPQTAAGTATSQSGRTSVALSGLQNAFYKHLDGIRSGIYDGLIRRGYYLRRPDHVKAMYLGGGFISGFGIVWLGIAAGGALGIETLTAIVAGVATGLVIMGFGLFMPARTESGAQALAAALGFREFLSRVESDRYRRMIRSPEQFEQYLPFAMALGVEERWASAFENLYREPPRWYRRNSGAAFRTGAFVRTLNTMSTRTSSTMTSRPSSRSSGGSGFGGGGRSGGGFGGGGGRGF